MTTPTRRAVQNHCPSPPTASWKRAAWMLNLLLLAAAFLAGGKIGRRQTPRGRPESPPHAAAEPQTPTGSEPDAERLIAKLDDRLSRLLAQRRRMKADAKADRISYQLLRDRGFFGKAPECQRLMVRQRRMTAAIARIEKRIAELQELQGRLYGAFDAKRTEFAPERLSAELRSEIVGCLYRSREPLLWKDVIPHERWNGGSNTPQQPNKSDRR
jgi:hypothetical protein